LAAGLAALERNDAAAARPLLEAPAAEGDPRAQGALGLILLDGLAGERDPARAEALCTASATDGAALGRALPRAHPDAARRR
jgi:TPR repeat protein